MNSDTRTHLWDPNGELTEEEVGWSLRTGGYPFKWCRLKHRPIEVGGCKTLVLGEISGKKHLVYIRATHDVDEEKGTGKMPLVLIDAALELSAEPHIVRINLEDAGKMVNFKYWGLREVMTSLKEDLPAYQGVLLKGKTVLEYLRIKKTLDVLTLEIELGSHPEDSTIKTVRLVLKINGEETACKGVVPKEVQNLFRGIDPKELLDSIKGADEFDVFTCDCGLRDCSYIFRGVSVVSEKGLTVWRVYYPAPCRVFVFEEKAYQSEILTRVAELISFMKEGFIAADECELSRENPDISAVEGALLKAKERIVTGEILRNNYCWHRLSTRKSLFMPQWMRSIKEDHRFP